MKRLRNIAFLCGGVALFICCVFGIRWRSAHQTYEQDIDLLSKPCEIEVRIGANKYTLGSSLAEEAIRKFLINKTEFSAPFLIFDKYSGYYCDYVLRIERLDASRTVQIQISTDYPHNTAVVSSNDGLKYYIRYDAELLSLLDEMCCDFCSSC